MAKEPLQLATQIAGAPAVQVAHDQPQLPDQHRRRHERGEDRSADVVRPLVHQEDAVRVAVERHPHVRTVLEDGTNGRVNELATDIGAGQEAEIGRLKDILATLD